LRLETWEKGGTPVGGGERFSGEGLREFYQKVGEAGGGFFPLQTGVMVWGAEEWLSEVAGKNQKKKKKKKHTHKHQKKKKPQNKKKKKEKKKSMGVILQAVQDRFARNSGGYPQHRKGGPFDLNLQRTNFQIIWAV